MTTTLYQLTAPNYLQILQSVSGVLAKGEEFCREKGIDTNEIVESRFINDMNPFRFQVVSVAHHSMGAMQGLEKGEFAPPAGYGERDYAGLQALVKESIAMIESLDPEVVNSYAGKTVTFKLGGNEIPFTAENFIASFSLPNFHFHATTTYTLLRMKGVPIGKRDFIGGIRMGV